MRIIAIIMAITQAKFDEGMKRLQASLDKILAEQKSFSVSIVALQDEVRKISAENANLQDEAKKLRNDLEQEKLWNNDLESRLLEIEVRERRLNLIVHGLPAEKHNQSVTSNVLSLLSDKLQVTEDISLTKCYRLKRNSSSNITSRKTSVRPAPVFISLDTDRSIQSILSEVNKLKGSGIRICSDLPPKLNFLRNELLSKGKEMRDSGSVHLTRIKQKGSKLSLECKKSPSSQWIKID